MYTQPTIGDLIEGVIISLNKDVMPNLTTQKAAVAVQVIQGVLVNVAQRAAMEMPTMVAEHNEMVALYRELPELLRDTPGPAADRIRTRSQDLATREELPQIPSPEQVQAAYRELSEGLVQTIDDLDVLITEGREEAEVALRRLREHTGPRAAREFQANVAGAGMVGRG